MNNVQELAMSEFLYEMTHEGKELASAYRELEASLQRPDAEIRELLESDENIGLSLDELKEKASHLTEEGRNKDYETLPVSAQEIEEERVRAEAAGETPKPSFYDIHDANGSVDSIMYERYQKAIEYRENVESKLNAVDNIVKKMGEAIQKIQESGVVEEVRTALKDAEANRRPGNDADKAYVDSLQDFLNFYEYFTQLAGGFRDEIIDRKAKFDDEFNSKRQAVIDNNEKLTAEIEKIRNDIKPLESKLEYLELEIERKERKKEFDEEYKKLVENKNDLTAQVNDIRRQIAEKQNNLQKMPTFDYNFDLYSIGQKDLIDLEIDVKQSASQFSDLEQQIEKNIIDGRNRAPRFEYSYDSDKNLIVSLYVNGSKKTKTVGDYRDISYENIWDVCRQLVVAVAAGSRGLDINTVGRLPFMVAELTPEGLKFATSKENDTFNVSLSSKAINEAVEMKKANDKTIDDLRKDSQEPKPTPQQPGDGEPDKTDDAPDKTDDEPDKTNDEPNQPDKDEPKNDKKDDYGYKCVSSRDFKIKVGNTNDQTRLGNEAQNRNYETLLKDRFARKLINPAIAAVGIFAAVSVPTLPVILAAGGVYTIANVLGHSPEIIEMARRHKLNKLAKKLGVEIGYKIDKDNYAMAFVDEEGRALSNEELEEIAKEKGIELNNDKFTGELDKIAGNKYRSKNYKTKYAQKEFCKFKNRTIHKINDYAYDFGLELDLDTLESTGNFVFRDMETGKLLDDNELNSEFKDAKADFEKEYDEGVKEILNDEYVGKLLISKKARKLNALSDVEVVKPNNLIALYDDIGGLSLKPRGRNKVAKFFKRRLDKIVATFDLEAQVKQNILSKAEELDDDSKVMDKDEVNTKDEPQPGQAVVDEPIPGATPDADATAKQEDQDENKDVDKTDDVEPKDIQQDQTQQEPAPTAKPTGLDIDSAAETLANLTTSEGTLEDNSVAGAADSDVADSAADTTSDTTTEPEVQEVVDPREHPINMEVAGYLAKAANDGKFDEAFAQLMVEQPELAEQYVIDHPTLQEKYDEFRAKMEESQGLGTK